MSHFYRPSPKSIPIRLSINTVNSIENIHYLPGEVIFEYINEKGEPVKLSYMIGGCIINDDDYMNNASPQLIDGVVGELSPRSEQAVKLPTITANGAIPFLKRICPKANITVQIIPDIDDMSDNEIQNVLQDTFTNSTISFHHYQKNRKTILTYPCEIKIAKFVKTEQTHYFQL